MKFSEYNQLLEQITSISELFNSNEKAIAAIGDSNTAKAILKGRRKELEPAIFNAFEDNIFLADKLIGMLTSVKDGKTKAQLGFILYILYSAKGKQGGWLDKGKGIKQLLNVGEKDGAVKRGIKQAQKRMKLVSQKMKDSEFADEDPKPGETTPAEEKPKPGETKPAEDKPAEEKPKPGTITKFKRKKRKQIEKPKPEDKKPDPEEFDL